MATLIRNKPQNQKTCRECNKKLVNKNYIKVWYDNNYEFFCTENCIQTRNVEYLDCTICKRFIRSNSKAIFCDNCSHWEHVKCTQLTDSEVEKLESANNPWFCGCCYRDVFPFSSLNAKQVCSMFNNKSIEKSIINNKIKSKLTQCFACTSLSHSVRSPSTSLYARSKTAG